MKGSREPTNMTATTKIGFETVNIASLEIAFGREVVVDEEEVVLKELASLGLVSYNDQNEAYRDEVVEGAGTRWVLVVEEKAECFVEVTPDPPPEEPHVKSGKH
jgi:hypothetical protein